jgi:hypothetical protein
MNKIKHGFRVEYEYQNRAMEKGLDRYINTKRCKTPLEQAEAQAEFLKGNKHIRKESIKISETTVTYSNVTSSGVII